MENNTSETSIGTNDVFGSLVSQYFETMPEVEQERWAMLVLIKFNRPDLIHISDKDKIDRYDKWMDRCFEEVKPETRQIVDHLNLDDESEALIFRECINEISNVSFQAFMDNNYEELDKSLMKVAHRYVKLAIDVNHLKLKTEILRGSNVLKSLKILNDSEVVFDNTREKINITSRLFNVKLKSEKYQIESLIKMRGFCEKNLEKKHAIGASLIKNNTKPLDNSRTDDFICSFDTINSSFIYFKEEAFFEDDVCLNDYMDCFNRSRDSKSLNFNHGSKIKFIYFLAMLLGRITELRGPRNLTGVFLGKRFDIENFSDQRIKAINLYPPSATFKNKINIIIKQTVL